MTSIFETRLIGWSNVYVKLGMLDSKEADAIRKKLVKYVEYTISDKREEATSNPYYSKITKTIIEGSRLSYNLPIGSEEQKLLKASIIKELNEVIFLLQTRF